MRVFLDILLTAIGFGLQAGGLLAQFKGSQTAEKAAEKAEQARKTAQALDAARRRRQIVREAQLARANALTNATSQGASFSSGLSGGLAQVEGQKNDALLGVNQAEELGTDIFNANKQQREGQSLANVGSAFQSIGGQIMQNRGAIQRVGTYAFG